MPVMLDGDHQFLELAKCNGVKMIMYTRYVDDGNQGLAALPPGTRWSEEEMRMLVIEDLIELDKVQPPDQRSLREIIINPMIQLTGDTPSDNLSKKMPVLDLACWVGEEGTVWWEHYRKPMANFLLMLESSAMPNKIKRTTMVQEGVRILRNCRLDLTWTEKARPLTDFSARMKTSGYCEGYRQ